MPGNNPLLYFRKHRVFREVPFGDETPCEGIEHEITDTVFNQLYAKPLHIYVFIAEKHASGIYGQQI